MPEFQRGHVGVCGTNRQSPARAALPSPAHTRPPPGTAREPDTVRDARGASSEGPPRGAHNSHIRDTPRAHTRTCRNSRTLFLNPVSSTRSYPSWVSTRDRLAFITTFTSGNNMVPCMAGSTQDCSYDDGNSDGVSLCGYVTGPGYDQVTGWGSVDAAKLVASCSSILKNSANNAPMRRQLLIRPG